MKVKVMVECQEDKIFDLNSREEVQDFMDYVYEAGQANVDIYLEEVK